jgi:hypothetical protein
MLRRIWIIIQLKIKYIIRILFSFLNTYYIEYKEKYLILHLKKAGNNIGKIYLPIDNNLRNKKVYLKVKDDLIDITHPLCIRYFLEPEDLNGQCFIVYEKENQSFKKIYSIKEFANS